MRWLVSNRKGYVSPNERLLVFLFPAVQRTFDFMEPGNCLLHVAFSEFPAVKKHQKLTGVANHSKPYCSASRTTGRESKHWYFFISLITCEHGYKDEDLFIGFSLAKLQCCICSNFSVVFLYSFSPQILFSLDCIVFLSFSKMKNPLMQMFSTV